MDNAVKGVVRGSGEGNHFVAGAKNAEKRGGNCVGSAHEIVANKGVFGSENLAPDLVKNFTAAVIVTVTGRTGKKAFAHTVVDESAKNFFVVINFNFADSCERFLTIRFGFFGKLKKAAVNFEKIAHFLSSFSLML